jgi:hypothetical protein
LEARGGWTSGGREANADSFERLLELQSEVVPSSHATLYLFLSSRQIMFRNKRKFHVIMEDNIFDVVDPNDVAEKKVAV